MMIVRQPVDVALAPTRDFLLGIFAGGSAFALLCALLGGWAAEHLAGTLRDLAAAANRVGDAPTGARLPAPRGYAEIGELTGALTALLDRLSECDRSLASMNVELEGPRRAADGGARRGT